MQRSSLKRTPKVFGTSYQPSSTASKATPLKGKNWRPVGAVIVAVCLAILTARLPVFQIKSVTTDGVTNPELLADLQTLVGHSIFSGQITRVTDRWLIRDQSLATLFCRRGLPSSVRCNATTRHGVLVWRQGTAEYWVDDNGRAFAVRQPTETAGLIVEDQAANPVKVGSDVASGEIVDVFLRLQQGLTDRAIVVRHFFIADVLYQPGALVSSFTVHGQMVQKDVSVLFAATESIDSQVRTLASLLAERGDRIQGRVDLRVPGYIYYH